MPLGKKLLSSNWLPARLPFYYGWVMLPIAILAQAATAPGQTLGVSIFNPSFQGALGVSLSQLTGAYMVGTLIAAVPQPYIGGLMDRFGSFYCQILPDITHHDSRAFLRQPEGTRPTNPAASSCDNGYFLIQFSHCRLLRPQKN